MYTFWKQDVYVWYHNVDKIIQTVEQHKELVGPTRIFIFSSFSLSRPHVFGNPVILFNLATLPLEA
jgi:hypothetical protein